MRVALKKHALRLASRTRVRSKLGLGVITEYRYVLQCICIASGVWKI